MDHNAVMIASFGIAVSVIGWFLKNEHNRNEKMVAHINDQLAKALVEFGTLNGRIDELSKLTEHVPDMRRFFGPRGGQSRLWGRIEHDVEQIREREHFLIQKLSIIKGSLDMQGIKCGNPETVWQMPEWKSYKPDMERV